MLRYLLSLIILLLICIIPSISLSNDEYASEVHWQNTASGNNPYTLSLQSFSINPNIRTRNLQVAYGSMLTYTAKPSWYLQAGYFFLNNNQSLLQLLNGFQWTASKIQPYVELYDLILFSPYQKEYNQLNYDVGVGLAFFGPFIPIMEVDNFFNNRFFFYNPQITILLNQTLSINVQYSFNPSLNVNSLSLKLNFSF